MNSKRVLIEKKEDVNVEARLLKKDLVEYLNLNDLEKVRVLNVYDIFGVEDDFEFIIDHILFEKQLDYRWNDLELAEDELFFRVKYLDGQFNQREDSINQMIKLLLGTSTYVSNTKLLVFKGIKPEELDLIKKYYINPVEMQEISLDRKIEKKENIKTESVEVLEGFIDGDRKKLENIKSTYGIGLDLEDLEFCQEYFAKEKRNPTITEIKLIDTYWSDHCRHTTFMTEIIDVKIEEGKYKKIIEDTFKDYLASRDFVYGETNRPICLMDIGTINQKEVKKKGFLNDKEETDEVNAASIEIDVVVDGKTEKWLLMFKNETHNHPTEIEPFGGAATCLGGAIRDPLSGRSYVYQAMRITGSADPRRSFDETIEGKLPQRTITRTAREGYSSYGYEIGAATGYVREIYDEGYLAKRMEVGALVAAAPKENVYRGQAEAGDVIVLVGGRTGRDGLGGAVGSSKKHTEDSMEDSGAEVQKGNPKMERKIIRLFRKKKVSEMIKVCNDFGAGGVSVAIGELADGVKIDLDRVPLKYRGLDGTEIALSESQERMAVVIDRENLKKFLEYSEEEDVEATVVAEVTEEKVLKMSWRGESIVNIDRKFLDTNGIRKKNAVEVMQPKGQSFFELKDGSFIDNLRDLNVGSQKGMLQGFDQTVGRGSVIAPYGGKTKSTPSEGMVAKIPVLKGETETCSIMTYGFEPKIGKWSTFHGGYYSVLESIARVVALGGSCEKIRLSLQEYFERLGDDPKKWGKPFSALLGAYKVQKAFDVPAIGGKDSMSGSFENLHVPPTVISFAVTTDETKNIITPEFKSISSEVGVLELATDENYLVDLGKARKSYEKIKELVDLGKIAAMSTVKYGGIARSIAEMSLGNKIGFRFIGKEDIYKPLIGSLVIEFKKDASGIKDLEGFNYRVLGETISEEEIVLENEVIKLSDVKNAFGEPLKDIFPIAEEVESREISSYDGEFKITRTEKSDRPRVLIPILTGTHGEYDLGKSFEEAGGVVKEHVFKTSNKEEFEKSIQEFVSEIEKSQIIAFPDGKIMGNEPESGGKLYKNILNMPEVKDAIYKHIYNKNRLIMGIGAGFQTLIKTGLIEYGEIRPVDENDLYIASNLNTGFLGEFVDVKVNSNLSPWLRDMNNGDVWTAPLGTKEGRIVGKGLEKLAQNGQVAGVFLNNLTGSAYGIDAMTSPCGRVFGCISSIDRIDEHLALNIEKKGICRVFESGINYFK